MTQTIEKKCVLKKIVRLNKNFVQLYHNTLKINSLLTYRTKQCPEARNTWKVVETPQGYCSERGPRKVARPSIPEP